MGKDGKKKAWNKSLKGTMLLGTVLLLCLLAVLVIGVSYRTISGAISKQTCRELERQCSLVENLYDWQQPGDFQVMVAGEDNYLLYKGGKDVSGEQEMLEEIKRIMGVEISVFYQDIRLATTLKTEDGESCVGTIVSPVVIKDVIETGEGRFYDDAEIFGTKRFIYYKPIFISSGEIFGMISVSREAEYVRAEIIRELKPLLALCVSAIAAIGVITVVYANNIIRKIEMLESFMRKVSKGSFSEDMNSSLLKQGDELGELARSSVKMQKSIRNLVEYDALTGLHNRRYADIRLRQVKEKQDKYGSPYFICIADIDFFKKVNDTYGHEKGDLVLKEVAYTLKKFMVGKGLAARWGGEEFLLVFEVNRKEEALKVLEEMLETIRSLEINAGEDIIKVTMSMGIAEAAAEEDIDSVLKRADELLYYGKEHGRNQIVD